jgi:hypothetical protein
MGRSFQILISAVKSKLFPAEDRQPKSVVFGWLTPLRGDISLMADVQISAWKSVNEKAASFYCGRALSLRRLICASFSLRLIISGIEYEFSGLLNDKYGRAC